MSEKHFILAEPGEEGEPRPRAWRRRNFELRLGAPAGGPGLQNGVDWPLLPRVVLLDKIKQLF